MVNVMTDKVSVTDLGKMYDVSFPDVTRVEVIDKDGRAYTNYDVSRCDLMLQDNNKTLKIFLK
jgi:hypothetical protein